MDIIGKMKNVILIISVKKEVIIKDVYNAYLDINQKVASVSPQLLTVLYLMMMVSVISVKKHTF